MGRFWYSVGAVEGSGVCVRLAADTKCLHVLPCAGGGYITPNIITPQRRRLEPVARDFHHIDRFLRRFRANLANLPDLCKTAIKIPNLDP
jgi:hypothetical protein